MNKKAVVYGFCIGVLVPLLILVLFTFCFISIDLKLGLEDLKFRGQLANVMRIGLLGNLALFTFLVRKKELLARGIVLATLLVFIISLIV